MRQSFDGQINFTTDNEKSPDRSRGIDFFRNVSNIFFGNRDELSKSLRVGNSKFSHHFAIDGNACFGQAADKFAVGNSVDSGRRVDTGNPQATEFAFFDASVAVCVLSRLQDGFIGFFKLFAPRAAITFGKLEDFFMTSVRRNACFHSRQVNLLQFSA